jgi:hypothetical protein
MNDPREIPQSDLFAGIEWLTPRIPYPVEEVRGDTFPLTWAADGEIYLSSGDPLWGIDFPFAQDRREDPRFHGLDIEKISGTPPEHRIEKVNEMLDYTGWGGAGLKPSGMLSLKGVLYLAVQNLLGNKPPQHGERCQHGDDAFIVASRDFGKTWTPGIAEVRKKGPMFPGWKFGGPAFVQYGRDAASPDGYVYAASNDQWDNGSELRIGRVRADRILDASSWEFVAEVDKSNRPCWTRKLEDAGPVLAIDRHVSLVEMVYLAGFRRYLFLTCRLHQDFSPDHGSELTVLESPEPWGPFRLVCCDDKWAVPHWAFYCPRLPLKWFDPGSREGWMLWSGSWYSGNIVDPNRPFYRAHVRKFRLK